MATTVDTQDAVNAQWGEAVEYTSAALSVSFEVTAGRHGLGEVEGFTSYGVYSIVRELYTFATDAIPQAPRLRDTIRPVEIDDDLAQTPARVVTKVDGSRFLKFWKVEASYPALASALDQTADVLRASNAPTDEGFRNPTFATQYDDVACRLQPDKREREWDVVGGVKTRAKYVCVFGSSVTLNAGDVVVVSSVRYEVTGQSEVESLGVLTFASVERLS